MTPLQLQRMAAQCQVTRHRDISDISREVNHTSPQPSVPHSCVGEVWSGFTQIDKHAHSTLLVHSNAQGSPEHFTSEMISTHLLGLDEVLDAGQCHAVLFAAGGLDQSLQGVHCNGTLPLPLMGPEAWSLVYTSPLLLMDQGRVGLALLGETDKMVAVSRERIADIQVRRSIRPHETSANYNSPGGD